MPTNNTEQSINRASFHLIGIGTVIITVTAAAVAIAAFAAHSSIPIGRPFIILVVVSFALGTLIDLIGRFCLFVDPHTAVFRVSLGIYLIALAIAVVMPFFITPTHREEVLFLVAFLFFIIADVVFLGAAMQFAHLHDRIDLEKQCTRPIIIAMILGVILGVAAVLLQLTNGKYALVFVARYLLIAGFILFIFLYVGKANRCFQFADSPSSREASTITIPAPETIPSELVSAGELLFNSGTTYYPDWKAAMQREFGELSASQAEELFHSIRHDS